MPFVGQVRITVVFLQFDKWFIMYEKRRRVRDAGFSQTNSRRVRGWDRDNFQNVGSKRKNNVNVVSRKTTSSVHESTK